MAASCSKPGTCEFEKRKYNPLHDEDKESINDMLNEELDIDFDDDMDLEFEGETVSEESSNEVWKVSVMVKRWRECWWGKVV
jgi:hypothetical protein